MNNPDRFLLDAADRYIMECRRTMAEDEEYAERMAALAAEDEPSDTDDAGEDEATEGED